MFKPLNGRVLIKPDERVEKTTISGIIIPEKDEKPITGVVVSGGEAVKTGERVTFSKFGYDQVTIEHELYYVVTEATILGVFL